MTMKSTCPCSEQESRGVLTRTRHVEAGETVDLPAVAGGSGDVEVAPGLQDEAVDAADLAADIVDVGGGLEADVAAGDAAAVDEIAGGVEVKGVAGDQGAVGLQVAATRGEVDLRDEDLLGAAVGQGDGLLDEPDDVAGELGELGGGEGDAEAEIELFGDGGAVVHQGLVFGGVAGVAGEGALAGELGDLFADQLLFVEAVAETFEGVGGVVAEGLGCTGWLGPQAQRRAKIGFCLFWAVDRNRPAQASAPVWTVMWRPAFASKVYCCLGWQLSLNPLATRG